MGFGWLGVFSEGPGVIHVVGERVTPGESRLIFYGTVGFKRFGPLAARLIFEEGLV